MSDSKKNNTDGLGFGAIKTIVAQLSETTKQSTTAEEMNVLITQLVQVIDQTDEKLQFLKDRYELLKRSNAALSDELVWLRDQLDDLSS